MKKSGVISLGEVIVDMISNDPFNTNFQPFLGGATVNLAVGVKRLGLDSYYLCKLGIDDTSGFVEETFKKEGVSLYYSVTSSYKKVCQVYVHQDEKGDRVFHSYINPTPDEWLLEEELLREPFKFGKIFYYGSGTLFHQDARKTTEKALEFAREEGLFVGFDVNIRLKRWQTENICRETICSFLKYADLVKMAEEELLFLTKTESFETAITIIQTYQIPYLFITRGSKGACAFYDGNKVCASGIEVEAVDSTGAGDAFMAALLLCFHEKGKPESLLQLEEYLHYANHAGALATIRIGSI